MSNDRIRHFSGHSNISDGKLTFAPPFKKFLKCFGRFSKIARLATDRQVGGVIASAARYGGKVVNMTATL
jgi:hypothetical protein